MTMGAATKTNEAHKLSLKELLEMLFKGGRISESDANTIWGQGKTSVEHPLIIVEKQKIPDSKSPNDILTMDKLVQLLASVSGKEPVAINVDSIDKKAVAQLVPYSFASRLKIVPLQASDRMVIFASAEPFQTDWVAELSNSLKRKIFVKLADPLSIEGALDKIYSDQKSGKAGVEMASSYRVQIEESKQLLLDNLIMACKNQKNLDTENNSVIELVDLLFKVANEERATDMHFEPRLNVGLIRVRVDGDLKHFIRMPTDAMGMVIGRIKMMGNMKLDEKRRPQDGRIKMRISEMAELDLRLSTLPTHFGEKLVVRISDPGTMKKGLMELGFYQEDIKLWYKFLSYSYGILLVTGPTGSGKTTTLYNSLKHIASPNINICTVEDPIEIVEDQFNQVQVNAMIDVNFENTIRAFLRQDPDVIMVGEIRDQSTGEMSIQAALTGHLVLSTLHTNSALSTITRLLDLGIQPYLINAALLGIMAQRLIKVLCPLCKKKVPTSAPLWKTLVGPLEIAAPEFVYEAQGCSACKNRGYQGRITIYELLPMTDALKDKIKTNVELSELEKSAKGTFTTLRENGIKKVLEGKSTIEEILSVVNG